MSDAHTVLRCPLCQHDGFHKETSRQESRWGLRSKEMTLLICTRCRYVLPFWEGESIFEVV